MITEYHIQLLIGKLDEIIANQNELIGLLKAEQCTVKPYKTEVTMEPEETTIDNQAANAAEQTPNESVTVTESGEPKVSTTSENEASRTKDSAKKFNKTQAFKDYKAAGGELSWNKWKAAGMPLEP